MRLEKEYGTNSRRAATTHKTKKVRLGKKWSVHARIKMIARINTEALRLIWNRSILITLLFQFIDDFFQMIYLLRSQIFAAQKRGEE